MSKSLYILTTLFLFFTMGCKPKNENLYVVQPPDLKLDPVKYDGVTKVTLPEKPQEPQRPDRYTQVDDQIYKSKVDILFVMDTSDSMFCDQKKMQENINLFTKSFLNKKDFLDFRIGVVSGWDSITFGNAQKDCLLGEMRPVGGKKGKHKGSCTAARNEIPYVTNQTSNDAKKLNAILGDTLKVGTEKFIKGNAVLSGPQHEELFSPVIAALKPENQKMNKNFRRADAHLAVIFFTDTDDFDYLKEDEVTKTLSQSDRQMLDVSAEKMKEALDAQKGKDTTVSTYAALARYDEWISTNGQTSEYPSTSMTNCSVNPVDPYIRQKGQGPAKISDLLQLTKGTGFDLKDKNYGSKFGSIGDDIVKKSLSKTILLDYPPEIDPSQPIIVKYGKNQIIPQDDIKGWSYTYEVDQDNLGRHIITINNGTVLKPEEGARFSVEYTPVKK